MVPAFAPSLVEEGTLVSIIVRNSVEKKNRCFKWVQSVSHSCCLALTGLTRCSEVQELRFWLKVAGSTSSLDIQMVCVNVRVCWSWFTLEDQGRSLKISYVSWHLKDEQVGQPRLGGWEVRKDIKVKGKAWIWEGIQRKASEVGASELGGEMRMEMKQVTSLRLLTIALKATGSHWRLPKQGRDMTR